MTGRPTARQSRVRRACAAVCLAVAAVALAGCRVDEPAPPAVEGPRLEVRETYGSDGARGVDLVATLVEEAPDVLGLDDVRITLRPGGRVGVRKLEAVLEEASLRVHPDGEAWPSSARSVPDQAGPALTRLQLALALLDLEGVGFDHPTVRLFDGPPTLGLTRVRRGEDGVRVHVLSLAVSEGDAAVAWGAAAGALEEDRVDLDGHRQILGEDEPEPVRLEIRRVRPLPEPTAPTHG